MGGGFSMSEALPSTIRHPETFLKAAPAGYDGVFDWSWTKGCFGDTNISPMDVDGIIERNGNFLVFETKNVGVQIPQGQLYTLQAMHRLGRFTIMIIHGKQTPERSVCWYPYPCEKRQELTGADEARAFVARWYKWANAGGAA
jgi:hypothetical protein